MARLRRVQNTLSESTNSSSKREVLKDKTKNGKQHPTVPSTGADKDTDDLLKNATNGDSRSRALSVENEDRENTPGARGDIRSNRAAYGTAAAITGELGKDHVSSQSKAKPPRRPPNMPRNPTRSAARKEALEGLMKRIDETARQEALKQKKSLKEPERSVIQSPVRSTGSGIPDVTITPSPPGRGQVRSSLPSVQFPGSTLRARATPAADVSTLALKHFKQRPRQGSMLHIVQQKIASARPSALHVPSDDDISSTFELGAASDEEGAFLPDAEGTPLQQRSPALASAIEARKRKSSIDPSSSALERLRAKKSKTGRGDIAGGSSVRLEDTTIDNAGSHRATSANPTPPSSPLIHVPQSAAPSQDHFARVEDVSDLLDAIPSTEHQLPTDPILSHACSREASPFDGTLAEPASSSSLTPLSEQDQDRECITADPVTQPSPEPPPSRVGTRNRPQPISTAHLQSLLPKRRDNKRKFREAGKKSIYEISSDGNQSTEEEEVDEDDDEDELAPGYRPQKRPGRKLQDNRMRSRQRKAPPKTRRTPARSRRKVAAKSTKQAPITYGRSKTSDKENEEYESSGESETTSVPEISMYEACKSTELAEAKKKFANIDSLELEFESMSGEDGHRSGQSWR